MNKYIVITTIFNPTEAVLAYSKMQDYQLIVVGDKKTPSDWNCKNVRYIAIDEQESLDFKLSRLLPYNHYCRKMLGYLLSINNGAEYIVDTDDDNIPKSAWKFPEFEGEYEFVYEDKGFINIYQLYTKEKIWPRGLPLNLINKQFELEKYLTVKNCQIGVWQGLADEDPDVDAIYRLTNDSPCYFQQRDPVALSKGTVCPFNTQNTIIRKELFALLYLPISVTFRFTDILRGLVAQPVMWLYGYHLGFTNATVLQKRNPHNYMHDFISELTMYLNCERVVEVVSNRISKSESMESNIYNAYEGLLRENIVFDNEMIALEAWLKDIASPKMP